MHVQSSRKRETHTRRIGQEIGRQGKNFVRVSESERQCVNQRGGGLLSGERVRERKK